MKKMILGILVGILSIYICWHFVGNDNVNQEEIASKLIRFHVIANSDSKSDQSLKLKVRDKVLDYISPKLENSQSIDDCREVLIENNKNILAIANGVIKEQGYNYEVAAVLSNENFPIKTYGNITLPSGKYEAYRIIIGNGEGHNWWCVMFPPLCFVDITKSETSYEEVEKRMKETLTDEEYNFINNMKDEKIKKLIQAEVIKESINNEKNEKKEVKEEKEEEEGIFNELQNVEIGGKPVKMKLKIVEIFKNILE